MGYIELFENLHLNTMYFVLHKSNYLQHFMGCTELYCSQ